MMKHLLVSVVTCCIFLVCTGVFAQTLYNPKNVDRTAMSFFDGQQTFRALEYTATQDQQSDKIYRLQTQAENGFPIMSLQGFSQGSAVYFEDKVPHDNVFDNNPSPYQSTEAVQIFSGFQRAMKVFDQRFGWKGSDGIGVVPVDIRMKDSLETGTNVLTYYETTTSGGHFGFERNLNGSKPFRSTTDIIAHEFTHSILYFKTGVHTKKGFECSEYIALNEGICGIFGIYIKNKILNSTPQNYDWLFAPQVYSKVFDTSNPKTVGYADTYNGKNYPKSCVGSSPYEAGGVVCKWFYLLTAGLQGSSTNDLGYTYSNITGIGVEKAIQIVWDAIPSLKANSNYPAFKQFTLQAAEKLHGKNSTEYQSVEKTWCAVGVCDNNLPFFSIYPANATSGIEPWPGVKVKCSWDDNPHVKEVEMQMASDEAFTKNPQTYKISNFDTFFKPGGGALYFGSAIGNFRPGETVYVRAKITQADPNFCKGVNPLCQLYQQFSPIHAFKLDDKKVSFWHGVPTPGFVVNAWDDPTIEWKPEGDAEKFTYQVATDKNFANLVYTGSVNASGNHPESGVITTTLETDKYYYVRVRAERQNPASLTDNWGTWSATDSLKAYIPPTSVLQALNQKPNDPPTLVSSLGFWVGYYTSPGAFQYLVQVATDEAFANIVRSQVAPGNVTTALITLPDFPDQTNLFVRVLPQKGFVYAGCTNVWRIKTDKNATLLAMKGPDPKVPMAYKPYTGAKFLWGFGSVNQALVDHFKLCIKKKGSGQTTCFTTPGKALEKEILDQLMFDDLQGIDVTVAAIGPQGAESGPSPAFTYTICPDHPFPKFPSDNDKIDHSQPFTIKWDVSQSIQPGDQYLVTLSSNGLPVSGFDNVPTTATSMVVPAGTLGNGKTYVMTVKNSGSCPAIEAPKVIFSTIAGGNNNPPATPEKDLHIEVHAYRNDLDLNDPFPFETSDYLLGFELIDPNGDKVQVVDANGNPVSELWVYSEDAVLAMLAKVPPGKYTLKLTMIDVVQPLYYNYFDQPHFSVLLNGQTVIDTHYIIANPLDPAADQWKDNVPLADITLDHQ